MIRMKGGHPAQSFDPASGTPSSDERYLNAAEVRQRYGNCTAMTIWRWIHDPQVGFPRPVKLGAGGLNFWWLPILRQWEARRDEQTAPRAAGGQHHQPEVAV